MIHSPIDSFSENIKNIKKSKKFSEELLQAYGGLRGHLQSAVARCEYELHRRVWFEELQD